MVVADFRDPGSVRAALRPGDRIFMVSVHEAVEHRIAAHRSFVTAAADVGVGLVAYLSIVNPSPTAAFHHGRSHYATEQMLLASGLPYAFLRMNLFLDDLPLWFDPDGVCRGPGGDGRVSLISREDTAAVSAGVLVGPGYEGEALDLTGEESHSLGELAALCSEILDRPLRYEPGTREAWIESRLAAGVPEWDANVGIGSYEALLGGEFDVTSDVVRRVTGTPAETARAWVEANPERFDCSEPTRGTPARSASPGSYAARRGTSRRCRPRRTRARRRGPDAFRSPWPSPAGCRWSPRPRARADVLACELEREGHRELALEHQRALPVGVLHVERRTGDELEESARIELQALGEGQRLSQVLDAVEDPVVGDELEARAEPGLIPEPEDVAGEGGEHRSDRPRVLARGPRRGGRACRPRPAGAIP